MAVSQVGDNRVPEHLDMIKWRGLAERWLGLLASRQALGSDGWSVYRGTARVPAKQFECFSIRLGNRGGL